MAEQPNQRRWNDSVSDLPAFHGNEKDTITAESITTRVEAAAEALTWDDAATFNNFSLAMRSNAEKWLTLQADIRPDFVKSWIYIKPLFREAFGIKQDESKVYGQSRENGNRRNRGRFSGGYYSNKPANKGNGNNGGNKQNKEAPKLNTKVKCLFCDIIGHHQHDCRKRIEAGKPCQAASGKEYFPKSKMHPVTEEEMDADMGQSGEYQSAIRENKSEYLFR